jgi:hypothetical protein
VSKSAAVQGKIPRKQKLELQSALEQDAFTRNPSAISPLSWSVTKGSQS